MGTELGQPSIVSRALPILLALLLAGLGYGWIGKLKQDLPGTASTAVARQSAETAAELPDQNASLDPAFRAAASSGDPVGATTLTGRVVDEHGGALAGIGLRLRAPQDYDRGVFLRETKSGAEGEFVLDQLDPAGKYTLTTLATDKYPVYQLEGFTPNSLALPLEIRLAPLAPVAVEGTVVDADHAPVANFTLTVASLDSQYPPRTVASDVSGYFRIDDFPAGALRIYTATPDSFRIQGLRAERDRYRNLTLVIDRGRYSLDGRVVGPDGAPIGHARVTLNSVIAAGEYHSHAYRTRSTDSDGRFRFDHLGGGAQVLGVYANGYRSHIENHVFRDFSDELIISLQR